MLKSDIFCFRNVFHYIYFINTLIYILLIFNILFSHSILLIKMEIFTIY